MAPPAGLRAPGDRTECQHAVREDQGVTSDPDITNAAGYSQLLAQIKAEVLAGRARAARAVNTEVIELSVDRTSGGLADTNGLVASPTG